MFGDFVKITLTRVESLGKKRVPSRVTIVSQRDSSRVTKTRDWSRVSSLIRVRISLQNFVKD